MHYDRRATASTREASKLVTALLFLTAAIFLFWAMPGCTLGRIGKPLEATAGDHAIKGGKAATVHPDGTEQSVNQSQNPAESSEQTLEVITERATPVWAPPMPPHWSSYAGSSVPAPLPSADAATPRPAAYYPPQWSAAGEPPAYAWERNTRKTATKIGSSQLLNDILDKLGMDTMGALYMLFALSTLYAAWRWKKEGWFMLAGMTAMGGAAGVVGALMGWGHWCLIPILGGLFGPGILWLMMSFVEKNAQLSTLAAANPALGVALALFNKPSNPPAPPS